MATLDDLLLEFGTIISESNETTGRGCRKFCLRLRALKMKVHRLHIKACNEYGTSSIQQFQAKRLYEAILGIEEFSTHHRDKVEEKEWVSKYWD